MITVRTSVLAAAGFLVAFTLVLRLGALSPTSSSECSALVSDWSELCWDDVSSMRDVAASERAADLKNKQTKKTSLLGGANLAYISAISL